MLHGTAGINSGTDAKGSAQPVPANRCWRQRSDAMATAVISDSATMPNSQGRRVSRSRAAGTANGHRCAAGTDRRAGSVAAAATSSTATAATAATTTSSSSTTAATTTAATATATATRTAER